MANSKNFIFMYNKFYGYVGEQAIRSGENEAPSYSFIERNFYTILSSIDWYIERNLWKETVSIEQGISRYLWVRGYWKLRIDYGQKVIDLARLTMDKRSMAKILMDDLGWTTYALLKDSKIASEHIEKAKSIFEKSDDYYNLVKCIRHLAAIARDKNDFDGAEAHYSKALSLISKISDVRDMKEMEAGFHLSLAKLYSKQQDYKNALLHIEKAIGGFKEINDELRLLKVLNNKAEILVQSNSIDEAIDIYQIVLESAKKLQRLDQVPIALEGLLKCY